MGRVVLVSSVSLGAFLGAIWRKINNKCLGSCRVVSTFDLVSSV